MLFSFFLTTLRKVISHEAADWNRSSSSPAGAKAEPCAPRGAQVWVRSRRVRAFPHLHSARMSEHWDLQRCARFREEIAASLSSRSLRSLPSLPPFPSSLLLFPPSSPFPFPLLPLSLLHAPSPSSQSRCKQLELNLIPLQFKGEQTRFCAQATLAGRNPPARLPQRQLTKMPNSVRISEEKPKALGRE